MGTKPEEDPASHKAREQGAQARGKGQVRYPLARKSCTTAQKLNQMQSQSPPNLYPCAQALEAHASSSMGPLSQVQGVKQGFSQTEPSVLSWKGRTFLALSQMASALLLENGTTRQLCSQTLSCRSVGLVRTSQGRLIEEMVSVTMPCPGPLMATAS